MCIESPRSTSNITLPHWDLNQWDIFQSGYMLNGGPQMQFTARFCILLNCAFFFRWGSSRAPFRLLPHTSIGTHHPPTAGRKAELLMFDVRALIRRRTPKRIASVELLSLLAFWGAGNAIFQEG